MLITLKELRRNIQNVLCESSELNPALGSVNVLSRSIVLDHRSKEPLTGNTRLESNTNRLIPSSFSLARRDEWWFMGNVVTRFRLKRGARILLIKNDQFYAWGQEEDTPLNRGRLISEWARENSIDVVKINIRAMDVEYAVLNLNVIERIDKEE